MIEVASCSALRSAVGASGPRIVRLVGSGTWDCAGARITASAGDLTVDGSACTCSLRDGWLLIRGDNVILTQLRIRTGDESVAVDADPISINGASHVVVDHVEAIWGLDVGGLTILNAATDITVQWSILGEGLFRSRHPEANDENGHSYAVNIAGLSTSEIPARITLHHNLLPTSHSRMPRVHGAIAVDVVNNVIFNGTNGPEGNPASLNLVGNWLRPGPASAAVGLSDANFSCVWRTQTGGVFGSVYPGSVYETDNFLEGRQPTSCMSGGQRASSPPTPLSIAPESTTGLLARVLAGVGPTHRDAVTQRILADAANGTGRFVNGVGGPEPRASWP